MTTGRVALVVVSHSAALAEAAVGLAVEMVASDPPVVEVAAGTPDGGLGTDAVAIAAAIGAADRANGGAGVLVLSDLGSAVLSSEMAIELVDPAPTGRVLLSRAPLVEGLVAAAVQAAAGAALLAVEAEAVRAVAAKAEHLGPVEPAASDSPGGPDDPGDADRADEQSVEVEVVNAQGLHARPAARFVAAAAAVGVDVQVRDLTADTGPVAAASMLELMTLGAEQGHRLRLSATGDGAARALRTLADMVADGLGES